MKTVFWLTLALLVSTNAWSDPAKADRSWSDPVVSADGKALNLEPYRGKVVYVDFWASWCKPCQASFPFMQELASKYGDDLQIIAVNVDTNRDDAEAFLKEFDVNFSIHFDPKGQLAEAYDVKGMPMSYLHDRNGVLIGSHVGFRKKSAPKLEAAIVAAIKSNHIVSELVED